MRRGYAPEDGDLIHRFARVAFPRHGFRRISSPSYTLSSVAHADSIVTVSDQELTNAGAAGAIRIDHDSGLGPEALPEHESSHVCDPDDASYDPTDDAHCPQVKIAEVLPEVGDEGTSITVTLKLSRTLTANDDYCYDDADRMRNYTCIQGGIFVWDTYNDHLYEDDPPLADILHKFVFQGDEVEKRIGYTIRDDECVTPGRTVKIAINWVFRPDNYGYTIEGLREDDNSDSRTYLSYTIPVNGDDAEGDEDLWADYDSETKQGKCLPTDSGATEELGYNRAPQFSGNPPTFEVAEKTAANQDVGDPVTATDSNNTAENPNTDTLTYSLRGTDGGSFTINSSTGQIKTKDDLDYETKSTYYVAVFVRDGKDIDGNPDTADDNSIDVIINVTDVNEAPAFDSGLPTSLNVVENAAAGVDIGNPLSATDPDNDSAFNTLTYSLDEGDGAAFEIDGNGQITTKDALDKETKSRYRVTVSVTDGKDAEGNTDTSADDTHGVTITVGDVNDPPAFEDGNGDVQTSTTREVAENTPAGRNIGEPVAATDPERDSLNYSLDDGDGASFRIDSNGQIKTKEPLDYEDKSSYSVTVSVSDGKDEAGNTETEPTTDATIDVTINVTDVNEKPKFADDAPTTLEVEENTATNTDITDGLFTATDPENDALTYSLGGTDASHFEIDSNGQVKTEGELNHEGKETYSIVVQVSDGRNDAGTAEAPPVVDTTHAVRITVTDVAEAPRFDGPNPFTLSVPETTGSNEEIGEPFTATDDDEGTTLTYTLGGTDSGSFSLDENTGQLSTNTELDFENTETYTVTITVDDGDTNTDDVIITVNIKVADENDAPEFDGATTTRDVAEDTAVGGDVGAPVVASDDDNDTLTYSLSGIDTALFDIDATTGQIRTKRDLDFEEDPNSYSVTVSVSDGKDATGTSDTAVDDTIAVTITVTNVDEDGVVTLSTQHPGIGAAVTATLNDPDGEITSIAWSWQNSDGGTTWADITGANSDIYTPVLGDLNKYLQATAKYTDPKFTSNGEKTVTADTDNKVRENAAPEFSAETATRSVAENTPAGRNIGAPVTATDTDADEANIDEILTYSLGGTDAESFSIVADTGQLQTKAALDYERKRSYSVDVVATDRPGATDTIAVTIKVIDVNEAPSTRNLTPLQVSFSQSSYSVDEGDDVTITVNVSPAADRGFEVPVSFSGSAEPGDYTVTGSLMES